MRKITTIFALLICAVMACAQTTPSTLDFSWTNNVNPTGIPACASITVTNVSATAAVCPINTVVCASAQVLAETDSGFAKILNVVSQTITPTAVSYSTTVPAVGTHYYALVATGKDASGNQCISAPATTTVTVQNTPPPPPPGKTLPSPSNFKGTVTQH